MATPESTTPSCPSCGCLVGKGRIYCSIQCAHVPFVKVIAPKACPICGAVFVRKARDRDSAVCCSRRCGWTYHSRVQQAEKSERQRLQRIAFAKCLLWLPIIVAQWTEAKREKGRLASLRYMRQKRAKIQRPSRVCICKGCGHPFDSGGGTSRGKAFNRRFCGKPCSKRFQRKTHGKRHTARARLRGLPYDYSITSLNVFTRDRWRCQLCRRPVPRRLMGLLEPQSPELDHIIPLSAAGSPGHVWANVQCACRACNGRKSSTPLGQTRLF